MSWKKVIFGNDSGEIERRAKLQAEFEIRFLSCKAPGEAAMLTLNAVSNGSLLIFSPGAVSIADSILNLYHAVECEEPSLNALTLLVGDHRSFSPRGNYIYPLGAYRT